MHWELWDIGSGNLVEDFATEDEALHAVREILAVNRPDFIDFLALGVMYDEGEPRDEELPSVLRGAELQARLAEIAQEAVTDTARKMHKRIMTWMAEERWSVRDVSNPDWPLSVIVTLEGGQSVDIFQHRDYVDRITVAQHWNFDEEFRNRFLKLSDRVQRDVIHDIYRDVNMSGLDLARLGIPPTEIRYGAFIYPDGLTKDALIQKMLLVVRMHALTMRTFGRAFAEAGHSSEAASNLLHLVPVAGGPQAAAS
jgi:hypothetical protein